MIAPVLAMVRRELANLTPRLTQRHRIVAGGVIGSLGIGILALAFSGRLFNPVPKARLVVASPDRVKLTESLSVQFDRPVDTSRTSISLEPATEVKLNRTPNRLEIAPATSWQPGTRYVIHLQRIPNAKHTSLLQTWSGSFRTQPSIGIARVQVDGKDTPAGGPVRPSSRVGIVFTTPMKSKTVQPQVNGTPVSADAVTWSPDGTTVTITAPPVLPYQRVGISFGSNAQTGQGDLLSPATQVSLSMVGLEPSNPSNAIGPNYQTVPPLEVVLENTPPAKPQSGIQEADMAYEYLSEYQVTRITVFYFNRPASVMGPVRSCRLISEHLNLSFHGITMCSGGSNLTLNRMFGPPLLPVSIWDFDRGNHYFTSATRPAPHHVFTDQARAERLRREWPDVPPGPYTIDSDHPDVKRGDPSDPPSVPLHSTAYTYDPGSHLYGRLDHGAPLVDALTGQGVQVKNVILVHANFHDTGFIEDESPGGGAHAIAYDVVGDGPAEIYSDGRVLHATWHMGQDTPMFFTDPDGHFIRLNGGLTWVHVLGNGQTH